MSRDQSAVPTPQIGTAGILVLVPINKQYVATVELSSYWCIKFKNIHGLGRWTSWRWQRKAPSNAGASMSQLIARGNHKPAQPTSKPPSHITFPILNVALFQSFPTKNSVDLLNFPHCHYVMNLTSCPKLCIFPSPHSLGKNSLGIPRKKKRR